MKKATKQDLIIFAVLALAFGLLSQVMPHGLAFSMFVGSATTLAVSSYFDRKRAKKLEELAVRAKAVSDQLAAALEATQRDTASELAVIGKNYPELASAIEKLNQESAKLYRAATA